MNPKKYKTTIFYLLSVFSKLFCQKDYKEVFFWDYILIVQRSCWRFLQIGNILDSVFLQFCESCRMWKWDEEEKEKTLFGFLIFLVVVFVCSKITFFLSWKKTCRSNNIILVKEKEKKSVVLFQSFLKWSCSLVCSKKLIFKCFLFVWDIFRKNGEKQGFGSQTFTQFDIYCSRVVNDY